MIDFITYSAQNVYGFSLVLIRLSGLCVVAPIYGGEQVPRLVRALFALVFTIVIYPALDLSFSTLPSSPVEYLIIVLKELVLGLIIGFLATAIFFGFQMGGRYISIHMGMSMGRTLDPFSNQQTTVIGQIFNFVVIGVFLVLNAHHFILEAIYESFVLIPPATVVFTTVIFDHAIKTFNVVVWTSLKIALPTMAALFSINLVFAFISRLVPRMNVFILSLPAKIGSGIIITTVALPAMIYLFVSVIEQVFTDINLILHAFS